MKENAEANFDIALQFEVINKCADPRAHIDIEELQQTQLDEIDKLDRIFEVKNSNGNNPLHYSILNKKRDFFDLFVTKSDLTASNQEGNTALHFWP